MYSATVTGDRLTIDMDESDEMLQVIDLRGVVTGDSCRIMQFTSVQFSNF